MIDVFIWNAVYEYVHIPCQGESDCNNYYHRYIVVIEIVHQLTLMYGPKKG